jgi:hypothetical protein
MIALHGNFRVILEAQDMPQGMSAILEEKMTAHHVEMTRGQDGDDGLGTLTDCAVFTRNSKKYHFVLPKILVA